MKKNKSAVSFQLKLFTFDMMHGSLNCLLGLVHYKITAIVTSHLALKTYSIQYIYQNSKTFSQCLHFDRGQKRQDSK